MMKSLIFVILLSFNLWAAEDGLPFETELTKLKLGKISNVDTLELKYHLSIPETQKMNPGAPSHVSVYEKMKGEKVWSLTKKIDLRGVVNLVTEFDMVENINLRSSDSEVIVHSTIYHCGKKDTRIPCFIQGFQGVVARNSKLKNQNAVNFKVVTKVY